MTEMSEYITDCVDKGLLYIEQQELDELSKNKSSVMQQSKRRND